MQRNDVVPVVFDASALLATVLDEPVDEVVFAAIREGTLMSAINIAEVVARLMRNGAPLAHVRDVADMTNVAVVPVTEELAIRTGELESSTRALGLSLADRCCLATAEAFDARIFTTDRSWLDLPAPWRHRVVCVRPD